MAKIVLKCLNILRAQTALRLGSLAIINIPKSLTWRLRFTRNVRSGLQGINDLRLELMRNTTWWLRQWFVNEWDGDELNTSDNGLQDLFEFWLPDPAQNTLTQPKICNLTIFSLGFEDYQGINRTLDLSQISFPNLRELILRKVTFYKDSQLLAISDQKSLVILRLVDCKIITDYSTNLVVDEEGELTAIQTWRSTRRNWRMRWWDFCADCDAKLSNLRDVLGKNLGYAVYDYGDIEVSDYDARWELVDASAFNTLQRTCARRKVARK